MKLFGSIFVLSMLSVMVSSVDNVSPPTGHTTDRSRVRDRNLRGTNSADNVSPPTGHTTGKSRVRARNLVSPPTGHTTGRSHVRTRKMSSE